jgi:hypothetical protein
VPKIKTYPEDEGCAGCGISHKAAREQGSIDEGELLQELECPECGRMGCSVCMPGGNNCICPECEEGAG